MTGRMIRLWLIEYARRPLNLVLMLAVPVVFVTMSAGTLAEFGDILSGVADIGNVEAATAGWAASVLAGVSAFFHVSASRDADRRLAVAGAQPYRITVSRLCSTFALAIASTFGALIALWARSDVAMNTELVGSVLIFAAIYTGIGVVVGSLVRSEMNGSLIVVFLWIFDVFFGPAMGGTSPFLRVFPLHYPALMITGLASGHAWRLGDTGISLLWATFAVTTAALFLLASTSRRAPRPNGSPHRRQRVAIALGSASRQLRRTPVMWVLLLGLPAAFITTSIAITPDSPTPVELVEDGRSRLTMLSMAQLHGAIMVPITVGFLSSLVGLFVVLDSSQADRRLSLTRFGAWEILAVRLAVVFAATSLATVVSVAVTAFSFEPRRWPQFVAANLLVALTYAMIGVIVGPLLGRLGGLYVMLVMPFIDVGIAQNAMFDAAPPTWGRYLPAHGAVRVMIDDAFTPTFDEFGSAVLAGLWLIALGAGAFAVFRRTVTT